MALPSRSLIPGLLFCLCLLTLQAWGLDAGLSLSQYAHDHWNRHDGLPASGVKAIAQTDDSYLWLGTTGGAVRFDGYRFTEIPTLPSDPSRREYITALCAGANGELWVGTQNSGLRKIQAGVTTIIPMMEADPSIITINRDAKGTLRYCSPSDFYEVKESGKHQGLKPNSAFITGISEDHQGRLWVSTHNGIEYFDQEGWHPIEATKGIVCTSLLADSHGGVWIGTWNYLLLWKNGNLTLASQDIGLLGSHVMSLYEDTKGNVWVGTKEGINRLKGGELAPLGKGDRFPLNHVQAMMEDLEGSLWVGTDDGLHRFKDVKLVPWTEDEGVVGNFTASVNEGTDGSIYIFSSGEPYGITRLKDGEIKRFTQYMDGPSYAAKDGSLWVSNTGALLHIVGDKIERYGEEDGIPPQWISFITEDSQGLILGLANSQGLRRWKPGQLEPYRYRDGRLHTIPAHIISAHRQEDGTLWLCGYDGLWKLKDGDLTRYTTKEGMESLQAWYEAHPQSPEFHHTVVAEGLADSWTTCVADDGKGTLWIASQRGGLTRLKEGKFVCFRTSDGLPSNQIYSVQIDATGDVWMSGPRGIFRVSGKDLEERAAGNPALLHCELFSTEDGMKIEECMHMYQPSGVRAHDGKLWFASKCGAVAIDPSRMPRNPRPPPVFIERLVVDGVRREAGAGVVTLAPGTEKLVFEYTAISLLVPERVRFKYRLEGYDRDWVDAGNARSAYYTRIPPGEYRFQVIACNNDGVWNTTGAAAGLVQKPFFFETTWFYLSCGAALLGLVLGIHRLRVGHLKQREIILQDHVEKRTHELSMTNEKLRTEMQERLKAEEEVERVHKQLLTASHQAGMAEVATGILHNVGNVLNSVNISTLLVIKTIRDSKAAGLLKVSGLMREHRADLGDYITKDPKGKHIPPYIDELAGNLASEQSKLLLELEQLRENVDHIKEIVAMQQNFAKVSSVIENVLVTDLLEDAIRINERAMERHVVMLERKFDELVGTHLSIERHKVLQILVNLLQNAKNACADTGLQDRRVIVRLGKTDTGVRIIVEDNGVGISPENMSRIFNHGFTTRKEGHGFGLHSSSLAAKSLGGVLRAESAGAGQGARFILELPLKPPAA